MPDFELRYPDESGVITYIPTIQPDIGLAVGPDRGIALEQTADGGLRRKRIHNDVGRWRRPFDFLSEADRTSFEAFVAATSGIRAFVFRDAGETDWRTVVFAGATLDPLSWVMRGAGYYQHTIELAEVPVPSVDALGAIRTGSLTISNLDLYADEAFSAAFSDNTWTMNLPSVYRTSGAPAPNYWLEYYAGGGSKSATGFRLRVSAPPGTGEAYTFEYLAVGS